MSREENKTPSVVTKTDGVFSDIGPDALILTIRDFRKMIKAGDITPKTPWVDFTQGLLRNGYTLDTKLVFTEKGVAIFDDLKEDGVEQDGQVDTGD